MPNKQKKIYVSENHKPHPDHGENESNVVCWYCGKENGDVYRYGDKLKSKAPDQIILNNTPCDDCAERMDKGFTYVVVSRGKPGHLGWFVTHDTGPGGFASARNRAFVDTDYIIKNNIAGRAFDKEPAH